LTGYAQRGAVKEAAVLSAGGRSPAGEHAPDDITIASSAHIRVDMFLMAGFRH
jgi:hypothetical protein